MILASVRPHGWDLPLFLHVLGAMTLFGAALTTALVSLAAWRRTAPVLATASVWALGAVGVPAYVLMRAGAQWTYSKEGFSGNHDPTWVGIGFTIADTGLLILLTTLGFAFWWRRSGRLWPGRVVACLSLLYLAMLAVAWLAMTGKWR